MSAPGLARGAIVSARAAHPSYRTTARKLKALPWRTAAPSWVLPGTVADNCRFLDGLVDEICLLFLETRSSLAYGPEDLPLDLARSPASWHTHLPLDLPWDEGPEAAAAAALALADKAAFLSPRAHVLHPPALPEGGADQAALAAFARLFSAQTPGRLLLENTRDCDLTDLLPDLALDLALDLPGAPAPGLCLDLGHLLAYNQHALVEAAPWPWVAMLHLSAPGPSAEHWPLTQLTAEGEALLRTLLLGLGPDTLLVLELFDAEALLASALRLWELARQWGMAGP